MHKNKVSHLERTGSTVFAQSDARASILFLLLLVEAGGHYSRAVFIGILVLIVGERAKQARHYQGCTNSSWCGICIYYKYSTLPCGISINIAPKVGIFSEAEG